MEFLNGQGPVAAALLIVIYLLLDRFKPKPRVDLPLTGDWSVWEKSAKKSREDSIEIQRKNNRMLCRIASKLEVEEERAT
tara:strand:+ start:122 stop:361 length:240 start_codon:yes stop_codon:yes gene_type:complete